MKVLFTADWHIAAGDRFAECQRVLDELTAGARELAPDLICLAGDLYDRTSRPTERDLASRVLLDLTALCPVIAVRGNHDAVGDAPIFERHRTVHPFISVEEASVHVVGGLAVCCLPWPKRASVVAATGAHGAETDVATRRALDMLLRPLSDDLTRHPGPRLVIAHAMVRGAKIGRDQPARGSEFMLSVDELASMGAHAVAVGHIHKHQAWEAQGVHLVIPGSVYHTDYGEAEDDKGFVVAEFSDDCGVWRCSEWRFVGLSATPMTLLDGQWDGQTLFVRTQEVANDRVKGANIRLRYTVDADQREAAAASAQESANMLRAWGAVNVTIDPVIRQRARARAPEITGAATLPDQLDVLWASKGIETDAARRQRLAEKLAGLEAAADSGSPRGGMGAVTFHRFRVHGFGPFDQAEIDLDGLGGPLVAVVGHNGTGKSMMLEACLAGTLYRKGPTWGPLTRFATRQDAFVEAELTVGGHRYVIRQDAGVDQSPSSTVTERGFSLLTDTKVTSFDGWAAEMLPAPAIYFGTQFSAQAEGGFLELTDGSRLALILKALGGDRFASLAKDAGKKRGEAIALLDVQSARIADLGDAEAAVVAAEAKKREAEKSLRMFAAMVSEAEAEMEAAVAEKERVEALAREAEGQQAHRAALYAEAQEIERRLRDINVRAANNRMVLAEADQINDAARKDQELAEENARLSVDLGSVTSERAAADREETSTHARAIEIGRRLSDIDERLAIARLRLRDQDDVKAAVAGLPALRQAVQEAVARREKADRAVEDVTRSLGLGAAGRIVGLRQGLEEIVDLCGQPNVVARDTLAQDDLAAGMAARHAEIEAAARATAQAAASACAVAVETLRCTEIKAALARRIADALRDLEQIAVERAAVLVQAKDAAVVDKDRATRIAGLQTRSRELHLAIQANTGERSKLASLVKKVKPLADAESRLAELEPQIADLTARRDQMLAEYDALPEPKPVPSAPDIDALKFKVACARSSHQTANVDLGVADHALTEARAAATKLSMLRDARLALENDLGDWTLLAQGLGPEGVPALIVDAAGPSLTEEANRLLQCFGNQWSVRVVTTRLDAKGKRQIETCAVEVTDRDQGIAPDRYRALGGRRTILNAAIQFALLLAACRLAGVHGATIVLDETGAALDPENALGYVKMLRAVASELGAKVLFVSHNPETWALADSRLVVEGGKVMVEA